MHKTSTPSAKGADARRQPSKELVKPLGGAPSAQPIGGVVRDSITTATVLRVFFKSESYWHGIIHRMEPDSFNAGYWFQRVGRHPIFTELLTRATENPAARRCRSSALKKRLDPFLFIDWRDEARERRQKPKPSLSKFKWRNDNSCLIGAP